MASVREIDPTDIKAVQYLDTVTPGKLSGVRLFMKDGSVHFFENEDLPLALAVAKERFPKKEGSNPHVGSTPNGTLNGIFSRR